MQHISDQLLLDELKTRFDRNQHMMREQSDLLNQLEKINSRLVKSEKVQSAFLSNIRNEINNPLTAIIGLSREMTICQSGPEQLAKNAGLIFSEAFILEFQLQNIFIAAELEAGQVRPYIVNVNVKRLLESTLAGYQHLILRKGLRVRLIADELIFKTDSEKLKIILSNLLMNAIGHSSHGGEIKIIVGRKKMNSLILSVVDEGQGIAEDKLDDIFDRFVQLDTGTTKVHSGHGLGLSVVRSLTEFVGGIIEVESKVGEGSKFTVSIPESMGEENLHEMSTDGNEFMFDTEDTVRI